MQTSRLLSDRLLKDALKNFKKVKTGNFRQAPPCLKAPFQNDPFMQQLINKKINCATSKSEISSDLSNFSNRIVTTIHDLGRENELFKPTHRAYNTFGERIDKLTLSPAWYKLKDISAEEGLIAIGYHRQHKQFSRIHQFAKLSYFGPHAGLYGCPLAMTDGAAHVLETLGETAQSNCFGAFNHLTSKDPSQFWTSGQWMTEKRGGSDVGGATDTLHSDGKLYGYKWFTSATDSEMTLTLARNADAQGKLIPGSKGLTMYFVKTTDDKTGQLNGIEIQQLKDKLGTKGLPTAELVLDGCEATQLGETGRGVPSIANMLHLTRLHNAAAAVGNMRQALLMSKDFSLKRSAFGDKISNFPLHVQNLARMEAECRAGNAFMIRVAELFGRYENSNNFKAAAGKETDDDKSYNYLLMRSLTPLLKLYTAKQAVAITSEACEVFGGSGYMEDSEMPVLLRDSQVLPIWEGTSNVMSLDVLRSIFKSDGQALAVILKDAIKLANNDPFIVAQVQELEKFARSGLLTDVSSRDFSMWLSEVYMLSLLMDAAESEVDMHAVEIFRRAKFGGEKVRPELYVKAATKLDYEFVFG